MVITRFAMMIFLFFLYCTVIKYCTTTIYELTGTRYTAKTRPTNPTSTLHYFHRTTTVRYGTTEQLRYSTVQQRQKHRHDEQ
jgi:hypothetical protein